MEKFGGYFVDKDPDGFGKVIALTSPWRDEYRDAFSKHRANGILLSQYNGWLDADISFLETIPFVEGVDILSEKVTDVRPLAQLKKIRKLGLTCSAKTELDLTTFKDLKNVFLTWRNVYRSVFAAKELTRINILDYPNTDLTCWEHGDAVLQLRISSGKLQRLAGIEQFNRVERFKLYGCRKIDSLQGIEHATSIRILEIVKCPKILDLSPISNLTELKELVIEDCGNIVSAAAIAKCRKIETLQIAGNTTIMDGDLSGLCGLPRLRRVLLAQRKHYTHRAEELEKTKK